MIKKLLSSVAVLLFVFQAQTAFSQCNFTVFEDIYQGADTDLTSLATCASYYVKYTIINTTGNPITCPFFDTIHLPDSIYHSGASFSFSSNNGDTVTPNFTYNSLTPIMTISNSSPWNPGDTITFTFQIATPCCVNGTVSQTTLMRLSNGCTAFAPSPIILNAPVFLATSVFPGSSPDHQNVGDVVDFFFRVNNQNSVLPI